MREHISKLANLYGKLTRMGPDAKVSEPRRCTDLIASLPKEYDSFTSIDGSYGTWDELTSAILDEEKRLKLRKDRQEAATPETAFAVGHHRHPARDAPASGRNGGWRGRGGHRRTEDRPSANRDAKDDQSFPWNCFRCEQPGHMVRHCPIKAGDLGAIQQQAKGRAAVARQLEDQEGPQRHVVRDKSQLINYRPAAGAAGIECADGSMMEVLGYGDLVMVTEKGETLQLSAVAHCPKAVCDLIGGRRLTQQGCTITFDDCTAKVINQRTGELVFQDTARGGGWWVALRPQHDRTAVIKDVKVDPVAVRIHKQLGHVNVKTVQAAVKAGLVAGAPPTVGDIGFCPTCVQGKMARTPHPPNEDRAQRAMELIHVDTFGPERMKDATALGGFKYGLVIVDDYTHHIWVKLMRLKSDAGQTLKNFHLSTAARFPDLPISRWIFMTFG
ncbi:hypothetical protein V8E36_008724 [Tilletia maclaganii]